MKFLFLIQCLSFGGMEKSAITTAKTLVDLGYDVEFISLHKPDLKVRGELLNYKINVSWVGYGFLKGFGSLIKLVRLINKINPHQIFIVGHSFSNVIACFLTKCRFIELNIHFHHKEVRPRLFWIFFYSISNIVVKTITFPSKLTMLEAIEFAPQIKNKCFISYTPVRLAPKSIKHLDQAKNIVVGGAGWLIKRKRFDLFIALAKKLLMSNLNFEFHIAGKGPELQNLKQLANSYGISKHIKWLGVCSDMDKFYKSIDIFVFFTDADAGGLVLLEAMGNNIPVFASCKYHGFYELIKNSKACYLQNNHNLSSMAKNISFVLSENLRYRNQVELGRKFIDSYFTKEAHIRSLFERMQLNHLNIS